MSKRRAAAAEAEADAVEETEETEDDGKSVTVTYPGGSRVYSAADHGKGYKKLAAQFAEKKNGSVA